MAYGNAMGYLPFREAIAEYLGTASEVSISDEIGQDSLIGS